MALLNALPLKHVGRPPGRRTGDMPPLLLLLHGVGSNEQDLFQFAPQLDPRFHVLSLRGPFEVGPDQHAWYPVRFAARGFDLDPQDVEHSRAKLIDFMDRAAEHYKADPSRVYLFGFSQGAIMSLALLLTRPRALSGVVAISGRTLPYLFKKGNPLGGHLAPVEQLKDKPLFLGHGTNDNVISVAEGRQSEAIFSRLPVAMTYREYEMPHGIAPECFQEVNNWLEAQLDKHE